MIQRQEIEAMAENLEVHPSDVLSSELSVVKSGSPALSVVQSHAPECQSNCDSLIITQTTESAEEPKIFRIICRSEDSGLLSSAPEAKSFSGEIIMSRCFRRLTYPALPLRSSAQRCWTHHN
jgi:hypothetical protein